MAFFDTTWYVNFGNGTSTGYYAVSLRPQNTAVVAGQIVRQFVTPSVGGERCFICTTAGTTANATEAWALTRGAQTTDGTAIFRECTGMAAVNGDLTNTMNWTQLKAAGVPGGGVIIKRNNGASYQIMTSGSGTLGSSEPAFSDTAGTTVLDGSTTWTSLGPVSNFTGGQAPHARLANALATNWFVSGNTVYVGDNHAETQASAINIIVNTALMARILCHNHSGPYPPAAGNLMAGATITTTGSGNGISLNIQGSVYYYGLTFSASTLAGGSGTGMLNIGPNNVSQVQNWHYFDNCSLQIGSTVDPFLQLGISGSSAWNIIVFNNTTVKFGSVNQYIFSQFVQFTWQNTGPILAAGSSVPVTLFKQVATGGDLNTVVLEAVDLSQLTGSLFANTASSIGSLTIKDCKLNAAATITQPINTGQVVQLSHSDSAAAAFRSTRSTYEAVESTETSIVRSGGYADPTGQVQSRKIVTSANSQWLRPYKSQALSVWNSSVGSSKTVTVYGTVNAGALPNNDDIWMEVNYLGDATSPKGSTATSGKAQVWSANAAVSSDSSSWGTPAPTFAVWSAPTNVTLSGGNLVATNTGTTSVDQGARGTASQDGGKFYFEATFTTVTGSPLDLGFGVGTLASTYTGMGNTGGQTGALVFRASGNVWVNGVSNTTQIAGVGTAISAGSVVGAAVDLTNRLIWFRVAPSGNWNGSGTANPATGVGGIAFSTGAMVPFCTFGGTGAVAGSVITANFGASSFTGTVPSGFTSGWPDIWQPFKLTATITPQLPGYIIPTIKTAKASTTYYIDPAVVVT